MWRGSSRSRGLMLEANNGVLTVNTEKSEQLT